MLKSNFLHPLLLSIYPIFFLYSVNADQMSFMDAAIPAGVSLIGVSLIIMIFNLFSRNLEKSSLLTTSYVFLFYSYGAFCGMTHNIFDGNATVEAWFPLFWGVLFLLVTIAILKSTHNNVHVIGFLNVISLVLVSMTVFNIFSFHFSQSAKVNTTAKPSEQSDTTHQALSKPDIYYIILDGYARSDVLQEVYQYDNSEFESFLRENGFFVADKSHANYCQTYLSVASSLNYCYLDELKEKFSSVNSVDPLVKMIADNEVGKFLKKNNYVNLAFPTGHSGTELKNADRFFSRDMIGREFLNVLLNSTYLIAFRTSYFDLTATQIEVHRNRINAVFDALPVVAARESGPVMVFAHLICPHPPFVFAEDGGPIPFEGTFNLLDGSHWKGNRQNYKQLYVNQLKYVTQKTKEMVQKLLADKTRKKVIIIQSDHGPGSGLDWQDPEKTNLPERMSILNAYYFDDHNYSTLYPKISPVNSFRVIFNKYFLTRLELLGDKSYFSKWWGRYQFLDVTDRLN